MGRFSKSVGILICGMLLVAGSVFSTAFAETPSTDSFIGEYALKLGPGPEGGAKERWLKPGVDFGKYSKVMLESVTFYFAPDSESKGIDPQELKDLADVFNLQIINALKGSYPIVSDPGPDVLRIRMAVTDLKASKPGRSAVSSVLPVGLGISLIRKGSSDSWTGSGATKAEFMILDSVSNDVIAVARDDRNAAFTERFSKWGSAEEAFKFWGERIKLCLDQTRKAKP